MFAYLDGKIALLEPALLIMDLNGVGYELRISLQTFELLRGKPSAKVLTYLQVKEDGHVLFGFYTQEERKMFLELVGISGIGPGTAIMVLSSLSTEELANAILKEDIRTIQAVKGIGAKTAQRIVLELKDKLRKEPLVANAANISLSSQSVIRNEALSALIALGINKNSAEKTLEQLFKANGENFTLEQLIKLALKTA